MNGHRQPLLGVDVAGGCEAATVLVVAAGELHVQRAILTKLGITEPKRIIALEPGTPG